MDQKYLRKMQRELSDELENDLYVSDVNIVDKLIEDEYLSADDWESIHAVNRPKKKVKQLVKCLGRAHNSFMAYKTLCKLLEKTHNHLTKKVQLILDKYEQIATNCTERKNRSRALTRSANEPVEHEESVGYSSLNNNELPKICNVRKSEDVYSVVSTSGYNNDNTHVQTQEVNNLNQSYSLSNSVLQHRNYRSSAFIPCPMNINASSSFDTRLCNSQQNTISRREVVNNNQQSACENSDGSSEENDQSDCNCCSLTELLSSKVCQNINHQNGGKIKGHSTSGTKLPFYQFEETFTHTSSGAIIIQRHVLEKKGGRSSQNQISDNTDVPNDNLFSMENSDISMHEYSKYHCQSTGTGRLREMTESMNETSYNSTSNITQSEKCKSTNGLCSTYFNTESYSIMRQLQAESLESSHSSDISDNECNAHPGISAMRWCNECKSRVSHHQLENPFNSDSCDKEKRFNSMSKGNQIHFPVNCNNSSCSQCNIHQGQSLHLSCINCCIPNTVRSLVCSHVRYTSNYSSNDDPNCNVYPANHCSTNSACTMPSSLGDLVTNCSGPATVITASTELPDRLNSSSSSDLSANTSESEINTEVNPSDLGKRETKVFEIISQFDGNVSDFMDSLIEQGCIENDDVLSVNKQTGQEKKIAVLSRLLCKPKKYVEHDVRDCDAILDKSMLNCNSPVKESSSDKNVYILNKYPEIFLRNFDKTFDTLNDKVNQGHLEISTSPVNPEEACITYYLQACDKLYHNDLDEAERLIENANRAAERSKHQMQLKGEVFTAKTWLYLLTGKTGKMLDILQQHEQLLAFMPGMWSPTACGWFYHDFARCYLKLLHVGGKNHARARSHYRGQALKSAKKAIEYFKSSNTSDGPIGIGFAGSLVVDALLERTDTTVSTDEGSANGVLEEAENVLLFIERQFNNDLPPVLKASYLLNRLNLCIRKGLSDDALLLAEANLKLCQELKLYNIAALVEKRLSAIDHLTEK